MFNPYIPRQVYLRNYAENLYRKQRALEKLIGVYDRWPGRHYFAWRNHPNNIHLTDDDWLDGVDFSDVDF